MSAYLSPIGNELQADANGAPLVGGKIYSYLAGTTTPTATYTGSDGLTPQSNPIVLNSLGLPANPIWLGAGVAVKLVIKDANDVTIRTVDNVLGVNDPSSVTAQDQWVAFSGTPTYLSATTFSVAGDQTATLQVNRRVKTTNSGGTVYSTISASAFGAGVTTVTVVNDSGTLDAGLSAVSYGIISALNTSAPWQANQTINRAYAEYQTNANLATVLPVDDTIPQITEGTQILSVSLTPKSASSRIRLRFQGEFSLDNAPQYGAAALFVVGTANALRATTATIHAANYAAMLSIEYEYVPGVTTALTWTVRAGPNTVGNMRFNGSAAGRFFGGVAGATLIAEEIAQ